MNEFIKVAKIDDIPEGKSRKYQLGEYEIAIFKIKNQIYIIDNLCSHQHAPVMSEGILEGLRLTCPLHGWTFDLETGNSINNEKKIRKYNFKVVGSDIFVEERRMSF